MTTLSLNAVTFVRRDPDSVFRELHDPETLLGCVPGATLTRLTGPGSFEARIAVGLGPFKAEYDGTGRIVASNPKTRTASMELTGDPSANLAAVRVRMAMSIAERTGGSEIRMTFDVAMSDRTWLLANGWLDPVACDLLDRTTRRLKQQLEEAPVMPFPPAA
jgi:carbon monoxide dehydrogenase subunit G